ncbi:RidA family protein [Photobacterium sp. GJ3]|uniref:RidA family protein n=1 Tax=Photobacterium sp. GJ3 TaxID=2829502 RepID=UPI001B8C882E|nr:RidA family protein [Photobacterium sp. GJ3]QUJ68539.1 RidA family protein [Photobacterium sp. GJ3]
MALNTQEVVQQNIEEKLQSLGITLPEASTPLANFVPYVISGSHVFISGQVPLENGQACFVGQVGDTISPEQAYRAAQLCAINILAQLKAACDGDLSRVKRIVRLGAL